MHLVPIHPSARVNMLIELKKLWAKYRNCKPRKKAKIMRRIRTLGDDLDRLYPKS